MPEGDTIAQSALTLAGVLVGRRVTGFRSSVPGVEDRAATLGVVGSDVLAVESRGKHLLLHFGRNAPLNEPDIHNTATSNSDTYHHDTPRTTLPERTDPTSSTISNTGESDPASLSMAGPTQQTPALPRAGVGVGGWGEQSNTPSVIATLRTHMRMTGSWHLYRAGSRWQKPAHYARVVVEAGDVLAVCFSAPEVELLTGGQLSGHAGLARLGPDLLAPHFDEADALARISAAPGLAIADALLDQSIMAGIGNVYKSEVCFLERVNPFQTVGSLPTETLRQMIRTARRQMSRNVGAMQRRTTHGPQRNALWVYDRAGQPCTRCGALIRRALQGPNARSTYWCPGCQSG